MFRDVLLGIDTNKIPFLGSKEVFHIAETSETLEQLFPNIQNLIRMV